MNRAGLRVASRSAVMAVAIACASLAVGPGSARANDAYPCGKEVPPSWPAEPGNPWSTQQVQPCPLTSPLTQDGGIPVYGNPVPNAPGSPPPTASPPVVGWLHGVQGKYFVCDQRYPAAVYHHPSGWHNDWWALTRAENRRWGWVPEVFFKGGDNNEPDFGLRSCPPPAPVPPPPPPPPPPADSCEPSPAASGLKLRASFRRSRRVATAGYRRGLRVRGRLLGADGVPVAGASLCVGVQDRADAPVRAAATIVTDAEGRFVYKLGRGPTRRVWFVHRVGAASAAASVFVRVRAPVALRARPRSLRNGQSVALRGRMGGGAVTSGLLVELQAARGRSWQTFATVRAGRTGRFRYRYRFTRTFGTRVYRMRARIPAQPGSPFASGVSRPVRVSVVG